MNTCTSCGATIAEGEGGCPQCGTAVARTVKPPSAWRRMTTGSVGVLLLLLGLGFLGSALSPDELGCKQADPGCAALGIVEFLALIWLGGHATVAGAFFVLATLIPFGTFRRTLVGAGAAVIGAVIGAVVLAPIFPLGWLLGLVIFFRRAYRIAR